MPDTLPPLLLARRTRGLDDPGWWSARSWLGGAPRLGTRPWPRSPSGKPMYFMAQIDLAAVARAAGPSVLPTSGALAFFMCTDLKGCWGDACIVHVADPDAAGETRPPADARPLFEPGADIFPESPAADGPRLWPRWPVDIAALPVIQRPHDDVGDEDEDDGAPDPRTLEAVERVAARRQYFLSAREAYATLGDAPPPHWWHSLHHLAACMDGARRSAPEALAKAEKALADSHAWLERVRPKRRVAGFGAVAAAPVKEMRQAAGWIASGEKRLAKLQAEFARIGPVADEVAGWAARVDPWTPMPETAVAQLKAMLESLRKEFAALAGYRLPHRFEDLELETLLALLTAEDRAYATVPEPIRALVNARYRLPTQGWHQMFGRGVEIQGDSSAQREEGNVMLLQLLYDDMMGWRFGDMGAFQFWLPPADLARGNWGAAHVTFECH